MRHAYKLYKQKIKGLIKDCTRGAFATVVSASLVFSPMVAMLFPASVRAIDPDMAQIRVHQKPDLDSDGIMSWSEAGQHVPGWTVRLYDDNFAPQPYGDGGAEGNEVVTTSAPYGAAAVFFVPVGQDYIICEVLKDGYTPSFQATINGWVSYDYTTVANGSGNIDEGENCIEISGLATDEIRAFAFGDRTNHVVPGSAGQTDQVVVPSDFANTMNTWTYHDDTVSPLVAATPTETEEHKIEENPVMALGDYGAARLKVTTGEKWNLATLLYSGTMLSDISEIGFEVYTSAPGQAYLNLDVDFDNTAFSTVGYQGRLVYVPSPVPSANTWQTYEAIDGGAGQWRWSRYDENGNQWPDGNTNALRSWTDIVTAFPNAEISNVESLFDFGGFFLRADGDSGDSTTFFDKVYLATATENIRYNFEPETLADGEIRIHSVIDEDEDGEPDWGTTESHQADWEMRLYNASWSQVDSVSTTGLFYGDSAMFQVQPGQYYVCEVLQDGYSYSFGRTITSFVTWPDASVDNLSLASDETEKCISVEVFPGQYSSHVFGNLPPEEADAQQQDTDTSTNGPTNPGSTFPPTSSSTNSPLAFSGPISSSSNVLGTTTDDSTEPEEDESTNAGGSSSTNFANDNPQVLASQDENGSFSNWLWWILGLGLLGLFILFALLRRSQDEEDSLVQ